MSSPAVKPRRILVVDDDSSTRVLLSTVLRRAGYEVLALETAEAALEVLAGERVSLLILDRHLPGIDGVELFLRARALDPEVQGILITAFPTAEGRAAAEAAGLRDYVVKPFQVSDLLAVCQAAIKLSQ